eukprot:CAMPEP_0197456992 /NCGR_PEP_ID=MMETSP1175-20131217/44856_1 /TAXON_ID=1003142 /ORGANISM="Triceratium dubium, Strain CCMP147" /LENGTH=40 /DNA_ID= /DNA_START= /DNA_END= /DNA_ORIENTATION=
MVYDHAGRFERGGDKGDIAGGGAGTLALVDAPQNWEENAS